MKFNADGVSSRIRSLAVSALIKYERVSTSARAILRDIAEKTNLSGEDAASLNMLVLGVLKRLNTIDFIISRALRSRSLASLSFSRKAMLRLAIFEGRWLETSVRNVEKQYLKDTARLRGVLQRALKINLKDAIAGFDYVGKLSILLSHPTFMVRTLLGNLPEDEAIALMKANNAAPEHYVRVNRVLVPEEERADLLKAIDAEIVPVDGLVNLYHVIDEIDRVVESKAFENGRLLIHDKASVAAVDVLSPDTDDTIWDACAAPGMKTQLIDEMLNSDGLLVASDVYPRRARLGSTRCKEMGCDSPEWLLADASFPPIQKVDKILIDAPCTSTGILQRDPSYKWRLNKEYLSAMMTVQHKILDSITTMFKDSSGVEILYVTCSLLPHEGESQIDSLLNSHNIELVDVKLDCSCGYEGFMCSKKVRRLFPHVDKTSGFFISKLRIPQ